MTDHLVIFDTQIKPKTDTTFCHWIGKYIIDHKPDNIIVIGDWWDMSSLSTYDKAGSLKSVGKNYERDIEAGRVGMNSLLYRKNLYNIIQRKNKKALYNPNMFFIMGNHEYRVEKFINDNPTLAGKVGYQDFDLQGYGFKVYDFLEPLYLDGIQYVHYVKNKNSNYPKASAKATIEQTMMSTIQGHKPGLDIYTVWSDRTGRNAWSIINGSSYVEDEDYRSSSGNAHWRGIAHLRNVVDGDFDPEFISMEALKEMFYDR